MARREPRTREGAPGRRAARPGPHALRLAGLAVLLVALGGCRGCVSPRPPIHLNPNMDQQPRYEAQEGSEFFADGAVMRTPVEGTVALEDMPAEGDPAELDGLATGRTPAGGLVATIPAAARRGFADDEAFAARGAERYAIYCAVCHGENGDGRGTLYHRSGVESGDLRQARLREVGDGHLFDVITHGLGLMSSYAAQVPVADRWAIVAHVRRMQAESPVTEGAAPGEMAAAAASTGSAVEGEMPAPEAAEQSVSEAAEEETGDEPETPGGGSEGPAPGAAAPDVGGDVDEDEGAPDDASGDGDGAAAGEA